MGAKLCCLRKQSRIEQVPQQPNKPCEKIKLLRPLQENIKRRKKVESEKMMSLQDHLLWSPCIHEAPRSMGGENHDWKQVSNRVHPSFSPEGNAFFTPLLRFPESKSLGKIEEEDGEEEEEEVGFKTPMYMIPGGSSSRKKVSFKLPEEADIIFYSPGESFEE